MTKISGNSILITGASGFLGTWLGEAAHAQGCELIGVDIVAPRRPELWSGFAMQTCDRADYAALIGSRQLGAVFHLAGGASVPESVQNPAADFASLLPGTVELLVYLSRAQRDAHLLLFSSAAVYGNPVQLPVAETALVAPISPYGIHKAAAEFLIAHYARVYGLRASMLRMFSAYGEGLRKQVVWDLCRKVMAAQRDGSALTLHGTGNETRDFIHASDIARAALLVAQHPPASGSQVINIASGEETSIRTLAESILRVLGVQAQLTFNGMRRAGDPANWCADVSRLRTLGFAPSVPFTDGIIRCVRWQKELLFPASAHSSR
jgi:UDP-glucose 4-epimerase